MIKLNMKYNKGEAELQWGKYGNGQTALQLFDPSGEPLCTASVCLVNDQQAPNQIFIKDWSENEGVLQSLIDAGILSDTGFRIPTGYVEAAVCSILVEIENG